MKKVLEKPAAAEDTYQMEMLCDNCGHRWHKRFPRGTSARTGVDGSPWECENCGCESARALGTRSLGTRSAGPIRL